jgi:sec-independent protein translocase protein TatA
MGTTGIQFANIFAGQDLLVIALLGLVLFGGKKIGELGKGLGEGIRNFKTAMKEDEQKVDEKKIEETKQV